MKSRTKMAAIAIACVVIAGPSFAADLPKRVFARAPGDEVQDVVFLGESGPLVFRFQTELDGETFRDAWDGFSRGLHRFLDGDKDGKLTLREATRGNWQLVLNGQNNGFSAGLNPTAVNTKLDASPRDGIVSIEELQAHLREHINFTPFGVAPGPPADDRKQNLFKLLDVDHDGLLTAADSREIDAVLGRYDGDEDEVLSLVELLPDQNTSMRQFFGQVVTETYGPGNTRTFTPLPAVGKERNKLVDGVISKYDKEVKGKPRDNALSIDEIGWSRELFDRVDVYRDGKLDASEIAAYLANPLPDLVITASVHSLIGGRRTQNSMVALVKSDGNRELPLAAAMSKNSDGGQVVRQRADEVEFRPANQFGDNRAFYVMQFANADADKNGYLDRKETQSNGLFFQFYEPADRDGDGKLFKKELEAFLDCQRAANASRAVLTVSNQGHSLFDVLDTDQDGRLSRRELRGLMERLKPFDRDGDGKIATAEVPRRYVVQVGSSAAPDFTNRRGIETYDSPAPGSQLNRPGPVWFTQMDRNHDGDVSASEFLGPLDVFRKLDRDSDGLLDAKEAAAAR